MCQSMSAVMSQLLKSRCFYILHVRHDLMYVQCIHGLCQSSFGAVTYALSSVSHATAAV
jgi:hypothetical protein